MAVDVDRLVAEIDADPAAAIAALASLEAALDAAARDRKSEVKVDVDRNPLDMLAGAMGGLSQAMSGLGGQMSTLSDHMSEMAKSAGGAGRGFTGLGSSMGGMGSSMGMLIPMLVVLPVILGAIFAIASVLPGAFAAIATAAGVLVGALVPLVGLLGAIPVGIAAIAGGAGVLVGALGPAISAAGLHGKAMEAQSGAMDQTADRARAVAMALRGLRDAKHAAKESAESLADAQRGLAEAAREARRALVDQREAVRDAHEAQRDAAESHRDALEGLRDAQENLRKAQRATAREAMQVSQQTDEFTGKVYDVATKTAEAVDQEAIRDAKEAVRDAREAVRDAVEGMRDANRAAAREQQRLNELERKGIKNSDQMVAARERLSDAQWAHMKALEAVKDAQYNVAQAQKRQNEATDAGTAAMDAYKKAMADLTPEGRNFVRFITGTLMPLWGDIKDAAQEGFLPGLQSGLSNFIDEVRDDLVKGVGAMARTMGEASRSFFNMWAKPENAQRLTDMWKGINDVLKNTLRVANPLSRVMVAITRAATPMVNIIMKGLYRWLDKIADWAETNKGAKTLTRFFKNAAHFGGLWMDVMGGVGGVLGGIARAAKPLAERWLVAMADKLESISDNLKTKDGIGGLRDYFERSVPSLKETWGLIKDISDVLFNSSQGGKDSAFYKFITALRNSKDEWADFFETMDNTTFAEDLVEGLTKLLKWINKIDWEKVSEDLDKWGDRAGKIERTLDRIENIDPTGPFEALVNTIPGVNMLSLAVGDGPGGLWKTIRGFNGWMAGKFVSEWKQSWKRNKDALSRFKRDAGDIWDDMKRDWKNMKWGDALGNAVDRMKRIWGNFMDWMKKETEQELLGLGEVFRVGAGVIAEAIKGATGQKPRGRRGEQQRWSGGDIMPDTPYLVGEKGPELLIPSTSGRIMPANPTREFLNSTAPGIDPKALDRVVEAIKEKKDGISVEQTFNEKVDPMHVASELAWSLR